ncbi:hypothetical protein [Clostridium sp.]|uniref:hypothetical protein n=1 Tax=Clostridium sp. TaxID=1506 RepID=UPI002625EBD0|nr:hypothetical protein [Clostridium sp.]
MKKFIFTLLIFLSFYCTVVSADINYNFVSPLTEGVYRVSNFDTPLNELQYIRNASEKDSAYFVVFDQNDALIQTIKLTPNSPKYKIAELLPGYKIVIVDKGIVDFSKE